MIALWVALALAAGLVIGFAVGCAQVSTMIARMSPAQIDALAAKVERVRDGRTAD